MSTQKYSVTPHQIETLLSWIKSGDIAVPEIQRPFVWDSVQVRNLLDSLYAGYPIGYLITWRNPTVRLKDGTNSAGKRILIDGQQRITALMASLLGREVLTKDYESARIKIAFSPIEQRFEVANPAIEKNVSWLADISELFGPDADLVDRVDTYVHANTSTDRKQIGKILQKLTNITGNNVGVIELADDLEIETVTEIFIRVNSAGVTLSQADFAMSKIASSLKYDGPNIRKAIDYFCHLSKAPDQANAVLAAELPDSFWTGMLPQLMDTSSATSPYFQTFRAAQAKLGDKGFLSRDIEVRDLLMNRGDVHHVFPRNLLKKQGLQRGRYNQIANFVVTQSEINIAIGDSAPDDVFKALRAQVSGGTVRYGGITDKELLEQNFKENCIPLDMLAGTPMTYDDFLIERRKLMSERIGVWFKKLGN